MVAPSAFKALSGLGPQCQSLDVHGDHWDMGTLTHEELSHLSGLTDLTHLGIYHFRIAFSEKHGEQPGDK